MSSPASTPEQTPVPSSVNHDSYDPKWLAETMASVTSVAMVGASTNTTRPSYFVMKYLLDKGFDVVPINPGAAGGLILGQPVLAALADLPHPVDMVDIFRSSDAAGGIVDEALALPVLPKVIWMQFNVRNDAAAARAEARGVRVVMNRCPKVEYARAHGELGWQGLNSGLISSKRRKIQK
ncbi:CoA-binding protein [Fodinicurvata sp. EGI_FJ10296]|uniref:CoA-binding protein n=1 Tax=Fodinicurvata sp. EGI_FJ10296 TaxID=3231908 RepID=UPI0034524518